jgi:hypothetical protein
MSFDGRPAERCDRGACGLLDLVASGSASDAQHDDAGPGRWVEAEGVREVQVERDERAALLNADLVERVVGCAHQSLLVDRGHVVTGTAEQLSGAVAEVLVELELQATGWPRSTYRPSASLAPYAMQARMSASSSWG